MNFAIDENGCWLWLGRRNYAGYGIYRGKMAHRVMYERLREPIPMGLVLDHLCHNKACINPDHLEAVTPQENTRRAFGHSTISSSRITPLAS